MIQKQFLKEPFIYRANTKDIVLSTDIYNPKKGKHINYEFNNYGFRCNNFDNWKNHNHRIAYLGCSYTEGIGLELEDTWPKVFHNIVCEQHKIKMPFWNLSGAASSTDHLTRYLYHYIEMLRPQIVVCYLPNLERRERWVGDYFSANTLVDVFGNQRLNKIFLKEEYVEYQTEKNFAMIDLLLENINSYMVVHSASHNFNIDLKNIKIIDFNADIMYYDSRLDVARDGLHPGPKSNKVFAERMYEYIKDIIEERLYVNRI